MGQVICSPPVPGPVPEEGECRQEHPAGPCILCSCGKDRQKDIGQLVGLELSSWAVRWDGTACTHQPQRCVLQPLGSHQSSWGRFSAVLLPTWRWWGRSVPRARHLLAPQAQPHDSLILQCLWAVGKRSWHSHQPHRAVLPPNPMHF